MELNLKDKDGNDTGVVAVLLSEENKESTPEPTYEYKPEDVDNTEETAKESSDEHTEIDSIKEDNKEDADKNSDESDDEDEEAPPKTIHECIERNYYVDADLRKELREEAYEYNQTQIRRNFCFLGAVGGGIVEFVELVILHSKNTTYKTILPIAIAICLIMLIVYHMKKTKYDVKIKDDYNKKYQTLCLSKSKFSLKRYYGVAKNKVVYCVKDSDCLTKISVEDAPSKQTIIELDEKYWRDNDFDIKSVNDYNMKSYEAESIRDEETGKVKGIKIKDYCYGSGFKEFYDRYNYNKITEYVVIENAVIDAVFDYLTDVLGERPVF